MLPCQCQEAVHYGNADALPPADHLKQICSQAPENTEYGRGYLTCHGCMRVPLHPDSLLIRQDDCLRYLTDLQ